MAAFKLLLTLAAAAARATVADVPAAKSSLPPRLFYGPTGQPATAAQDAQSCGGVLLLPARVEVVAKEAGLLRAAGSWSTEDGATLVTWVQELFGWSPEVYYSRGSKTLYRAVNVGEDTVDLQDCEGAPMYSLRVRGGTRHYKHEIFNKAGELLATSRYGIAEFFPEQLFFFDPHGGPVAVAQSPMLGRWPMSQAVAPEAEQAASEVFSEARPRDSTKPQMWQVAFYNASNTNSSLVHAQHRWVVLAAVQDHLLRDAILSGAAPNWRPWFVALSASAWLLLALVACTACHVGLWELAPRPPGASAKQPITWDAAPYDYGSRSSA